jgi:hypothetical protein
LVLIPFIGSTAEHTHAVAEIASSEDARIERRYASEIRSCIECGEVRPLIDAPRLDYDEAARSARSINSGIPFFIAFGAESAAKGSSNTRIITQGVTPAQPLLNHPHRIACAFVVENRVDPPNLSRQQGGRASYPGMFHRLTTHMEGRSP